MTPAITGLAAGTYTTDVTVTAAGVTGSPKTIPVTLTVDPPARRRCPCRPPSLSFSGDRGRAEPGGQDAGGLEHRRRDSLDWTASESRAG